MTGWADDGGERAVSMKHLQQQHDNCRFPSPFSNATMPPSAVSLADSAVHLRGASKSYGGGEVPVLQNLDMTVPRGCIYGLLGASGCGKTTLVRCALGRVPLDGGEARLLGHPLGDVEAVRVGYMPQEAALLGEFSIREALVYYGRLFHMSDDAVQQRMDFLGPLLQLPSEDNLIRTLSGGQQRRVSLAATLVHSPELLFLDEPTVGLDPVLRHNIWEYLIKLTEENNTTVIITTHYIEEAQQAHIVGLMRLGKLMAEDCPKNLISTYNCVTLEEVFLNMSVKQESIMQDMLSENTKKVIPSLTVPQRNKALSESKEEILEQQIQNTTLQKTSSNKKEKHNTTLSSRLSSHRLKALTCKNFLIMRRYPGNIMGIFLFPFLQISLFFLAIGGYPSGIKIAVVNEEVGVPLQPCSLENITNGNYSTCDFINTSCMYLNLLDNSSIIMEFHEDMKDALQNVAHGKTIGVIHFHKNFSKQLEMRLMDGTAVENDTLYLSEIGIHMDMTEQHTASLVKNILYEKYNVLADILSTECAVDNTITKIPMQFNQPIYGPNYPKYDVFMLPGVLTSMMYFLATTLTAVIMVRERQEGIWSRDMVAGVTSMEILISHILCQAVFLILQCIEIILVATYFYGMKCKGNIFLIFFILLLQGFCGLTFGLVIAVLSSSITVAMYMCLGIYVPFINLSGVIWPIEGMPKFLQWVSYAMPTTLATVSTSNVLQKAWSIFHPQVLHGIITTLLWVLSQVTFAICMLKFK